MQHSIAPENKIKGEDKRITLEGLMGHAEKLAKSRTDPSPKAESTNAFPLEVFPAKVQDIILATKEGLAYPIDYTGVSILLAASIAIGNTYKAKVSEGWIEGATLYVCLVGRAGVSKSHPLTFALAPLFTRDKASLKVYKQERDEYNKALGLSKKQKDNQGIELPPKPAFKKYIVSDSTPEALAEVQSNNVRGIGLYSDELAGWIKCFNRYHSGNEQEFWLSNWSGKAIIIDRKSSEPIYLDTPFISVGGTIQPGVLEELAKNSRNQNGFIDRMLFSFPDGLKKEAWSDTQVPEQVFEDWRILLGNLSDIELEFDETGSPVSRVLRYAPDAWQELKEWQSQWAELVSNAESEAIGSLDTKLENYCIRLSLILELLYWGAGEGNAAGISLKAVRGAIQLIAYFRASALKVHGIISNASPLDRLDNKQRKLYEALPNTFTTHTGLEIALSFEMPERTYMRFIKLKEIFDKLERGEYEKLY